MHMKYVHEDRAYKCDVCDNEFVVESYLEKHISDITGTSSEANHIARLQGTSKITHVKTIFM